MDRIDASPDSNAESWRTPLFVEPNFGDIAETEPAATERSKEDLQRELLETQAELAETRAALGVAHNEISRLGYIVVHGGLEQRTLRQLAYRHDVSHLPNRLAFETEILPVVIGQVDRDPTKKFALFSIDLTNFKAVNDQS